MTLAYDTKIHIDHGRQDGDAITPWTVFCWARGEGVKPVRVQAHEGLVKDLWGVDRRDEEAVKAAFRAHREKYLAAATLAPDTGEDFGEFTIG